MSAGCKFYYEDSYRKSPIKECRLIGLNPESESWQEKLCGGCPVPNILEHNPCSNLALEAQVASRWGILKRVKVFAVCTVRMKKVGAPMNCNEGCSQFKSLF